MVQPRRWLRRCIVRESPTAFGVGTGFPNWNPGFPGTLGWDSEARRASSSVATAWIAEPNPPIPPNGQQTSLQSLTCLHPN